jgi:hypothetical protein
MLRRAEWEADEVIMQSAAAHGALPDLLRAVLLQAKGMGGKYVPGVVQVLASAGPQGATIAECVSEVNKRGLAVWDPKASA